MEREKASTPDESGLDELRARLLRAVRASCPRWLADSAEDITQQALVRLRSSLASRGENFASVSPSYLKKTAYHAVVDVIRSQRQRRERERPTDEEAQPMKSARSQAPDPERVLHGRRIGRAIQECLAGLVPPRRAAAYLHLQGHAIGETGEMLGWTKTKTVNLIYRGLGDLRRCLAGKGWEP